MTNYGANSFFLRALRLDNKLSNKLNFFNSTWENFKTNTLLNLKKSY